MTTRGNWRAAGVAILAIAAPVASMACRSDTDAHAPPQPAVAVQPPRSVPAAGETLPRAALEFLAEAVHENARFVRRTGPRHFAPFVDVQSPRVTLVTCSDSRVQTEAFDSSPENDVFTIRNIGNQIVTSEGSVEYGVEHLHTPLLLVVGHTGCGAVEAAMGDFGGEPESIRRELQTLDVPKARAGDDHETAWSAAVIANVEAQVRVAVEEFADEVDAGRLVVVGAVYDLRNDDRQGFGRLHIVAVNGATDAATLRALSDALDGVYRHPG